MAVSTSSPGSSPCISAVAATPEEGTSLWGWAIAASSIAVAILAPITGAVADQGGRVKPWLAITTLLCAVPTALLWFVEPSVAAIMLAVVLIAVANFGYEMSMVFYNALLPSLVLQALAMRESSAEELTAIRKMLDELEGEGS